MALNSIWNRIGIHALLSSNTYLECLWLTHILILTTQNRVIYHLQSQSHHQHYHYLCIMVNAMRVAGNIIGAKLYEKCFITTRCTFAVTNEWERGWQTDNQTRLRVLCVSVYRHSHTHTHTHQRTCTHTSAKVWPIRHCVGHAQTEGGKGGAGVGGGMSCEKRRHTKWVMKRWQDILLHTEIRTHA